MLKESNDAARCRWFPPGSLDHKIRGPHVSVNPITPSQDGARRNMHGRTWKKRMLFFCWAASAFSVTSLQLFLSLLIFTFFSVGLWHLQQNCSVSGCEVSRSEDHEVIRSEASLWHQPAAGDVIFSFWNDTLYLYVCIYTVQPCPSINHVHFSFRLTIDSHQSEK